MILSTSITVGQITFILRVAIQILGYGGLAIIGLLILGNAPRVAPIDTHDVINRAVGKSTATLTTLKWIFNRFRRNHSDPAPQTNLLLILLLFVSYAAFIALSDIGFLGLYACPTPGPSFHDVPASIGSDEAANKSVTATFVDGTDPSKLPLYRCNSTEAWQLDIGLIDHCTSWRNSTYADPSLFEGLNSTDTDVLTPLRLAYHERTLGNILLPPEPEDSPPVVSFYVGPGIRRVTSTTIQNGIVLQPHDAGARAILGVPQLLAEREVHLGKTLAVEFEFGCHSIGIFGQGNVDSLAFGVSFFVVDDWAKYNGPDYMEAPLLEAAQKIREFWRPQFDESTEEGGDIFSNSTTAPLSLASRIQYYLLPTPPGANTTGTFSDGTPTKSILGNCTEALQKALNLEALPRGPGNMCGLLGTGGSVATMGKQGTGFSYMVCAAATQINMVSADVAVNQDHEVSVNFTRLPSDLHYNKADLWYKGQVYGNTTGWVTFDPYQRFTLSDNPVGPTTHYIAPSDYQIVPAIPGAGSSVSTFQGIGNTILTGNQVFVQTDYSALPVLDRGFAPANFGPTTITRWLGEVAGSFVLASVGYNGYAARSASPVLVTSTGGKIATCYKPAYAFGFVPLVCCAVVVVCWMLVMAVTSGVVGYGSLKDSYGGTEPYVSVVYPEAPPTRTLASWNKGVKPYLQLVSKGEPMTGDPSTTAIKYFKSDFAY